MTAVVSTLLAALEGCTHASAIMPWGEPGPILLPEDPAERTSLIETHIAGGSATVTFCPRGRRPQSVTVNPLALIALCPAADGLCRWIGFDLDAANNHGAAGLVNPRRAAACIAERCDAAGLLRGLIVVRSRSGRGRHLWLLTPGPVSLEEAVLVAAGLSVRASRVAAQDAAESSERHALLCGDGSIAPFGKSGTWELIPPSTDRPQRGWALMLPAAGALAANGGGVIVDPFYLPEKPMRLSEPPCCDAFAWGRLVAETRAELDRRQKARPGPPSTTRPTHLRTLRSRIDPRTRSFLDGHCPPGQRNRSLYIAVRNLIGVGVAVDEAERLALHGALACGLTDREARATIRSALRAKGAR